MGQHKLFLDIPDTSELGILVIKDISSYDDILPVTCPTLQITPPGYGSIVITPESTGFDLVLNACQVGLISASGCTSICPTLPDGIWTIRYSVAPNDQVYVVYRYMRTVEAMARYFQLMCALNVQCCTPSAELIYQMQQLDIIRNYILAAKLAVEECNRPSDGINILRFANSLMDKLSSCKPAC